MVEVAEGQFARRSVNGSTKAEAGEVGLRDAAPESVLAEDGEDMVVVVDGFEVHEERRIAVHTESCRSDEGAFEAVSFALAESTLRGPGGVGVLVWDVVDELLDLCRSVESAKCTGVFWREPVGV